MNSIILVLFIVLLLYAQGTEVEPNFEALEDNDIYYTIGNQSIETNLLISRKNDKIEALKRMCRSGFQANKQLRDRTKELRREKLQIESERQKWVESMALADGSNRDGRSNGHLELEIAYLKQQLLLSQRQIADLTQQLNQCENKVEENENSMVKMIELMRSKRDEKPVDQPLIIPEAIQTENEIEYDSSESNLQIGAFQNGTILINEIPHEDLPEISPIEITKLDFSEVVLDSQVLIRLLKKTVNFEYLHFHNVKFSANKTVELEDITLPSLRHVLFNETGVIRNIEEFHRYLESDTEFFTFNQNYRGIREILIENSDLDLTIFYQLNASVHYVVDGIIMFNWSPYERSLTSLIDCNHQLRPFLSRPTGLALQKLSLSQCEVDANMIPENLTHLTLYQVNLTNGGLSSILKKCRHLIELKFRSILESPSFIYVIEISPSIKTLSLWDTRITLSELPLPGNHFVQIDLDQLVLHDCELENSIMDNFPLIFKPKNMIINGHYWTTTHPYTLLTKILKIDRLEQIVMYNLSMVDRGVGLKVPEYAKIERFLRIAGVSSTHAGFILNKDESAAVGWTGTSIQWNTSFEPNLLVFKTFDLNKFVNFERNNELGVFPNL